MAAPCLECLPTPVSKELLGLSGSQSRPSVSAGFHSTAVYAQCIHHTYTGYTPQHARKEGNKEFLIFGYFIIKSIPKITAQQKI